MGQIGIISDTHGIVPDAVGEFFGECEEIWHAGDIGDLKVLEELAMICPVKAVYGNIDGREVRSRTSSLLVFEYDSLKIMLKHIVGRPGKYNAESKEQIEKIRPTIVVAGHSHILSIKYDEKMKCLYINPGAAGKNGLHKAQTMVRLRIEKSEIKDAEVWEKARVKAF
ncbi:MAG: YfcE family phosphodiesterase [Marinilabiliales bacterium]|nr:MAG: YfcE family phosphodiesterase [Marinilabiliales bacterium]